MREEPPDPKITKIVFSCCFCGKDADSTALVSVVIVNREAFEQTWWGHLGCFKEALHPTYRSYRPEFE